MYLVLSYVENAFSSFHDSAPISSAALVGLGGRAVGVKAIGSVDGNGLSWKGGLQAERRLLVASFIKLTNGTMTMGMIVE